MTNNNELYHYGVPGMRWGVRRADAKLQRVSTRAKKRGWSDDATEVAKIQTKKVNQMSNNELTKVNNRKTLEQNYTRLNPNAIKKGIAIAGATAAAIGTLTTLYKYGKTHITAGKKLFQKTLDSRVTVKGDKSSKAFWEGMKHLGEAKYSDFKDLLQ